MITIGDGGKRISRPYDTEIQAQPAASTATDYGSIIKGLQTIKEKYDSSLREKAKSYGRSGVEEKTFDTDDDLYARATSELDSKYTPKRTKVEEAFGTATESAKKEKAGLGSSYAGEVRSIRLKEDRQLASQAERAARRGVSDSSIARLEKAEIAANAENAVTAAGKYYADRVNALNDKIRRTKETYDDAMRGYEISYAIELEKKMEKYRAQRDKLLTEYERSVSKDEEKRIGEYLKEEGALNAAYERANGDYAGEKRANYNERYEYLQGELDKMTATERKGFLKAYDSILQDYLGLYYAKLQK